MTCSLVPPLLCTVAAAPVILPPKLTRLVIATYSDKHGTRRTSAGRVVVVSVACCCRGARRGRWNISHGVVFRLCGGLMPFSLMRRPLPRCATPPHLLHTLPTFLFRVPSSTFTAAPSAPFQWRPIPGIIITIFFCVCGLRVVRSR